MSLFSCRDFIYVRFLEESSSSLFSLVINLSLSRKEKRVILVDVTRVKPALDVVLK